MCSTRAMAYGPLTDLERYSFDLNGFLVRRNVLSIGEVRRLHIEIDALHLPPPSDGIMSQRFSGLIEAGGLLRDLVDDDAVLDVARELCGPAVRLDHAYGIVMAPGTAGLGLHGGGASFDPAQYYAFHGGRINTGLIAVQWAVSDHAPGEGGFCCIPGSHKANYPLPHGVDLNHELAMEVPLAPGDLVVFSEALTRSHRPPTPPLPAPIGRRTSPRLTPPPNRRPTATPPPPHRLTPRLTSPPHRHTPRLTSPHPV